LQKKDSFEIYKFLEKQDLLSCSDKYWWPNIGSFEVVVGTILTQNTTWKNVEKSLKKLDGYLELDSFLSLDEQKLKELIRSSGFYNQKAPRLLKLAQNIKDEFRTFKDFQNKVSREWLLQQKGIGKESADSILCYGCFRDEMVVDSYTKRFLKTFDIEFKNYDEYKEFLEYGMKKNFKNSDLNLVFARFHGMIVEYSSE
jgi:endonuclease-3 related protein